MLTSFDEKAMDFRHAVRDWLATAIPDEWRSFGGHMQSPEALRMRRDWDRRLYDGGYAGLTWPVEYGGRGLGVVEEAIFYEECALAAAPEGLGRIGRGLAGPIMMAFGSEEQRARYLQPILAGDEIWCEGLSEPEAGSDLASLRTTARPGQDGYRVSGSKIWTSYAHYAQYCLLLARTSDSAPRHHNLGLFIVALVSEKIASSSHAFRAASMRSERRRPMNGTSSTQRRETPGQNQRTCQSRSRFPQSAAPCQRRRRIGLAAVRQVQGVRYSSYSRR